MKNMTMSVLILFSFWFTEAFFGVRHLQYFLLFSVTVLGYGLRNILNVAVIAMISENPPEGVQVCWKIFNIKWIISLYEHLSLFVIKILQPVYSEYQKVNQFPKWLFLPIQLEMREPFCFQLLEQI